MGPKFTGGAPQLWACSAIHRTGFTFLPTLWRIYWAVMRSVVCSSRIPPSSPKVVAAVARRPLSWNCVLGMPAVFRAEACIDRPCRRAAPADGGNGHGCDACRHRAQLGAASGRVDRSAGPRPQGQDTQRKPPEGAHSERFCAGRAMAWSAVVDLVFLLAFFLFPY